MANTGAQGGAETVGLRSVDESPSPTGLLPMRPLAMLSWAAVALTLAATALQAAALAPLRLSTCSRLPWKLLRESRCSSSGSSSQSPSTHGPFTLFLSLSPQSARWQLVPMVCGSIFRCAGPLQYGSNGMRRRYKPRSGGTLHLAGEHGNYAAALKLLGKAM
jgi:hypothetical protein